MVAVRDHLAGSAHHDALLVVVTFTDDPMRLDAYRAHLGLDGPIVADVERNLYHAVGARRGSLRRVWSPGTLALYARLLGRGRRLRTPTEDTRQLGADLVVDRTGRIARIWLPPGPDRRPAATAILDALADLDGA